MDLWQLIGSYRANILQLAREVGGAIGGGTKSRNRLFRDLDDAVERYLGAMERVIHPALAADARTRSYVPDLEREHEDIRRHMDELGAVRAKDTREWSRHYRALVYALEHYFNLQEHGAFTVARGILDDQAESLRRAFEREQIAALQARRWHVPVAVVPARYGVPTGMALAVVAGVLSLAIGAIAWRQRSGERHDWAPGRRPQAPPIPQRDGWEIKRRSQENRNYREEHPAWMY